MTADSLTRGQYPGWIFEVFPSFCVTWLWSWKNLARRRRPARG